MAVGRNSQVPIIYSRYVYLESKQQSLEASTTPLRAVRKYLLLRLRV